MTVDAVPPQAVGSGQAAAKASDGPAWGRVWEQVRPVVLGFATAALVVLIWQLATAYNLVNTQFLSPPLAVWKATVDLVVSGDLLYNLGISAWEFALGLGISIVVGAVLGILVGWWRPAEEALRPLIIGLNSMPHVAVIPVLILLFGIGVTPKVVIVVLSCAIAILLNTATGVMTVDSQLMRMSRSFGAKDLQAIRTVVLPATIPFFMTGVRISVGRALVAVVVSEFFASKAGVGNVMISAANSFNMPRMYAMLFIITALGILLTQGATWLENRMQRWRD